MAPTRVASLVRGRRHRAVGLGRIINERFRETEVQNLDLAVLGLLDVGRFQIPMNDPSLVSFLQGVGDLVCDVDCLFQWDGTA